MAGAIILHFHFVYWPRLWNAMHRRSIKAIFTRIMKLLLSI